MSFQSTDFTVAMNARPQDYDSGRRAKPKAGARKAGGAVVAVAFVTVCAELGTS
jgi:hypothetical protein